MSLENNYFINNPVFVRYKKRWNFACWSRVPWLKSVCINERIVEIPFAIASLAVGKAKGAVLDVGCMESLLPLYLAGLGYQVTGVDLRDYPYDVPNFKFVRADIMRLPFPEGAFDAVTCISTLEHIGLGFYEGSSRQDRADAQALQELRRVLKTQGVLVLTVPYGIYSENAQQRTYDWETLQGLLAHFQQEEVRFFKSERSPQARNNFWQEVPLAEARQVKSGHPPMVCLLRARKCV